MPQAVAAWVATSFAGSTVTSLGTAWAVSATTAAVYGGAYVATTAAVVYGTQAISKRGAGNTSAFADTGRNVMSRDPIAPQRKIYGQVLTTGPMYPVGVSGTKNEFFWLIVSLAGHKCDTLGDLYFGDEALNDDGSSGIPTGKYADVAFIGRHWGTDDQLVDDNLHAALPTDWPTTRRGRGIAHLVVRLKNNNELFSGLPTVRCMVKGALVYDPRDDSQNPDDPSTWKWSANAALCAADFLHDSKFGKGVPWSRIDMAALIEAANICDEDVVLDDSTTEKRYTVNGTVTSDQDRNAVLTNLADAMAGTIIDVAGRWTIRAGAWRSPTLTLGDSDLAGGLSVQTRQSMQDTFNGVKGVFISPINDWQPSDFPVVKNDTYKTKDGGVRRWKDIALNFTTSPATSQRIAKIDLERGRQQITFTALYKLKALQVLPGDVVYHNRPSLGWTNKPFEATDWALRIYDGEGGGKCLGVAITWRETAEGVWDWANGEETTVDLAPNTDLPNPSDIPTPSGLTLLTDSGTSLFQSDGTFIPRLKLTWNPSGNTYVEHGGFTSIEYKKHSDTAWLVWNKVRGDLTVDFITDVKVGEFYDVRIQHISSNGVRSHDGTGALTYNTVTNYKIEGDTAPPDNPTSFFVDGGNQGYTLEWTNADDVDLAVVEIEESISGDFTDAVRVGVVAVQRSQLSTWFRSGVKTNLTRTHRIRSIDETGNANSAWVTGSPVTANDPDAAIAIVNAALTALARDLANDVALANDQAAALITEVATRAAAITSEATTRSAAITAEATTRAADILAEAVARGAAITTEQTVRAAADTSLASSITTLTASVATNAAAISTESTTRASADSALSTSITTLGATVSSNTAAISTEATTRASADSALSSSISALTSTVSGNTSAITSEATTRASADSALSSSITTLTSSVASNAAAITSEASTRSSADSSLSSSISTLSATVSSNYSTLNAAIISEQTARVSDTEALARDLSGLLATINDNSAAIARELTVRTNDTESLARDLSRMQAVFNDNAAAITQELTVRTTATTALASSITSLTATVGTNTAAIATESTARASADSALSSSITSLTSSVGSLSSSVTILASAYIVGGSAVATWGFKLDGGGKVIGMQAIAASGGTQADTNVIIFSGADLRSDNYSAGVSGWKLEYGGTAYLEDAIIRGRVELKGSGTNVADLYQVAPFGAGTEAGYLTLRSAATSTTFSAFNDLLMIGQVGDRIALTHNSISFGGGDVVLRPRYGTTPTTLADVIALCQYHGLCA